MVINTKNRGLLKKKKEKNDLYTCSAAGKNSNGFKSNEFLPTPLSEHSEKIDVDARNEEFLEHSEDLWQNTESSRWVGHIETETSESS